MELYNDLIVKINNFCQRMHAFAHKQILKSNDIKQLSTNHQIS